MVMARPLQILTALLALMALAACTGSGVEPSSLRPLTSETAQTDAAVRANAQQGAAAGGLFNASASQPAQQVAAINTNARVRFAPAIGVSADAIPTLSARLRARAGQRGLTVVGSGDGLASHVLKGYFSAFSDGGQTTVIYVWDVLDPSGNRLHRIQGQQSQQGTAGEGWSAVTTPTMEAIADRTIDDLAVWLSSSAG